MFKAGKKELELRYKGGLTATRVYLIRHGEVANIKERCYNGHNDVDLSPTGITQMQAIRDRISDEPVKTIYTSDLIRCFKGAEIIAESHGITPVQTRYLREKNFGVWEGLNAETISKKYREDWEKWIADPVDSKPASGESYREVEGRVMKEFERIIDLHEGEVIVVIAHGGVNRIILCHALNLPIEKLFKIEQDFGSFNIIDYYKETAIVKLMNG